MSTAPQRRRATTFVASASASATAFALAALALLAPLATVAASPAAAQRPEAAGAREAPRPRQDVPRPDPANVLVDPTWFAELEFRSIGPSRGGRVTAVAGHPAHPHTFYMGATGGGVWKTEDAGITWRPLTDGYLTTGSIGAIRVAPSAPDIVYVGTGSDGLRSNIIVGRGIWRSDDAGETWRFLGLRDAGQIGAVEVHPTDPDRVYAAALGNPFTKSRERGVYRSSDGGRTWEHVLFVADSVGAVDLELHPTDPNTMYASLWRAERKPWTIISGARALSGAGIWKSTDAGTTWRRSSEGLPDLIGKTDLAVSAADPDRVYALVEALAAEEGLYRSDDRGETWRLVSNRDGLMDRPFYYTNVDAGPKDADVVWVGSTGFFKSTDGGENWTRVRTPHADNHDMWINPDDPRLFIQSNDGGANVTLDGGRTWSTQLNQPTAELYQVELDDRFPRWAYAGQQDNSTIGVPLLPPASWTPDHPAGNWVQAGGCETGPLVPAHGTPYIYANCKGRFGVYDRRTGQERQYYVGAANMYGHAARDLRHRFQRVAPIEVSPHDSRVVYHGSQYVHRTTDHGQTWETISPDLTARPAGTQGISGEPITRDITGEEFFSTLYAVQVSPHDPAVIWVGSNDGLFHVTRDGGATWRNVTPPDMPPLGRVQNIDVSPHVPGKAYFAYYRWLADGDYSPYVYRTTDYGRAWTRLTDGTNGIPADYAVRVVREDPDRAGLLYAGTEFGLFISFDDGAHWQPFQQDLPVTPVTDLKIADRNLVLSTMGRGFWVMDDLSPLHQLPVGGRVAAEEAGAGPEAGTSSSNSAKATAAAWDGKAHLFAPRRAYRMRYRGGFGPGDAADPEYPPPGATIDYWFGETPRGEVVIEVVTTSGEVVRGFSSAEDGWEHRFTQGMREPRTERIGGPRIATTPGHHRLVWDLSWTGPWSGNARRRGGNGPLAVPGSYRVRMTVDGRTYEQPLELRADPRVLEAGITEADMAAQHELGQQVAALLARANQLAARIDAAQERLGEGEDEADRQALERLAALESELLTDESVSSYPQPMLQDQIGYLYSMITSADQRPGRDAYERFEELGRLLGELEARVGEAGV